MSPENKRLDRQVRHLDKDQRDFDRKISRRKVIIGAIAGILLADQGLAKLNWGDAETKVNVLPEYEDVESSSMWLVSPGLGVQNTYGTASVMRPSLEIIAPVAYMQVGDEGLSVSGLARAASKLCHKRKVKTLHLWGDSMGLGLGAKIAEQVDGVKVDTVIGNCSPRDRYDAKQETIEGYLSLGLKIYHPGYLGKLFGETLNSTAVDPNHSLSFLEQLKDGARVTKSGVAPEVWRQQLLFLGDLDTGVYPRVIGESAAVAHVRPIDPDKDKVVNNVQAYNKLNNDLYGTVTAIEIDIDSHASVNEHPGQYNEAVTQYLRRLSYSRDSRRRHRP